MSLAELDRVSFSYGGGGGDFVLREVSLRLEPGELLGVLGPNGAGKSTLLKILAGVLRPASGRALWEGTPFQEFSPRDLARRAALVPQESDAAFSLSVEQAVSLGFYPRSSWAGWRAPEDHKKRLTEILNLTGLSGLGLRLLDRLSGGEKRRVLVARALAQGPRLLLLDEPTAHLDPRHQADLVALVDALRRDSGLAVVAALHDVNLALAWCPRLLFLKDGRPLAQGPAREAASPETLRDAYGLPAQIVPLPGRGGLRVDFFKLPDGGNR